MMVDAPQGILSKLAPYLLGGGAGLLSARGQISGLGPGLLQGGELAQQQMLNRLRLQQEERQKLEQAQKDAQLTREQAIAQGAPENLRALASAFPAEYAASQMPGKPSPKTLGTVYSGPNRISGAFDPNTGGFNPIGQGGPAFNPNAQTQINMPPMENEAQKTAGKYFGDMFGKTMDAGSKASTKLANLSLLGSTLSNPNVYQGAGGETVLAVKKAAQALGFDMQGIPDSELAQKIGNTLALELRDPSQGGGMPGNMSDADRNFVTAIPPGLTTTPEGNAKAVEWLMRGEKQKIALAKIAADHMNSGKYPNAELAAKLAKYAEEHPIFSDDDRLYIDELRKTAPDNGQQGQSLLSPAEEAERQRLRKKFGRE